MKKFIHRDDFDDSFEVPEIKIIDGTWHMPTTGLDAFEIFKKKHIPNAIFVDLEETSDQKSNLPHMMPDNVYFSKKISLFLS